MKKEIKIKKIFFLILSIFLLFNVFVLTKDKMSGERIFKIYESDTTNSKKLSKKNSIMQKFKIYNNQINAIILYADHESKLSNDFTFEYRLLNKENNVLCSGKINLLKKDNYKDISIYLENELMDMKNEELLLELSTQSNGTLVLKENQKKNLCLSVITTEKTIYSRIAFCLGIVLIGLSCLIYLLIFFFQIEYHKIFFIAALVLGTIICFLIPVGNVPDEANAHITTAYHYSNILMGIESDRNNVKERQCDLDTIYSYIYFDNEKMLKYINDLTTTDIDTKLVDSNLEIYNAKFYSFTYYLSAVGISIGRVLGLNGILCILLGRLCNFTLFLGVATYCIKKIPVFKGILSFVCLLPITLQQVFSLSYDSIVITLAMLITMLTIKLYHDHRLNKWEHIILSIACVLISLCKSFSYFPIIFAPLSYYLVNYLMKLEFKKEIRNKKKIILFVSVFIALLILFAVLYLYLRNTCVEGSLLYLLVHPKLLYLYFRDTLYLYLESFVSSSLANSLGLMHITIYNPILICYYILLFYMITNYKRNNYSLPNFTRVIFIGIFIVCFTGILLAMYSWAYSNNLINDNIIVGFQGRYLIPVMPLFLIALCKKDYNKEDITENKILYLSVILAILTIFSIMIIIG